MLNRSQFQNRNNPQKAGNGSLPGFPSGPFAIVPPPGITSGGDGGENPCDLVMANLSAYVDNELNSDERRVVEAHVEQCAECAAGMDALRTNDAMIQREWRECVPLPSSFEFKQSVDSIMAALPPVPNAPAAFARKRVHSRLRWIRFSTGLAGIVAFCSLLWSSYRLGYTHGRMSLSVSMPSATSPLVVPDARHNSGWKLTPIHFAPSSAFPQTPSSVPPLPTSPSSTFARSLP